MGAVCTWVRCFVATEEHKWVLCVQWVRVRVRVLLGLGLDMLFEPLMSTRVIVRVRYAF